MLFYSSSGFMYSTSLSTNHDLSLTGRLYASVNEKLPSFTRKKISSYVIFFIYSELGAKKGPCNGRLLFRGRAANATFYFLLS